MVRRDAARCRLMWNLTSKAAEDCHVVFGQGWGRRFAWQTLECRHSQIRNGDKVCRSSKATRNSFCLLEQTIHGLHISIAVVVQHDAYDSI